MYHVSTVRYTSVGLSLEALGPPNILNQRRESPLDREQLPEVHVRTPVDTKKVRQNWKQASIFI